jgi:formylglycine-generating enzyme required for sulfatase activity
VNALPRVASVGLVALLASTPGRTAPADDTTILLSGPARTSVHLRLAESHFSRHDCGAAVFHYQTVLPSLSPGTLRQQVEARLKVCRERMGWVATPPAPSETPLGWPYVVARRELVSVPAGPFLAGGTGADRASAAGVCAASATTAPPPGCLVALAAEPPGRVVTLPAFRIDRTEVTWNDWARCVHARACSRLGRRGSAVGDEPVTSVSLGEARAYCRFAGGRLPTEVQWEKAARGAMVPPRSLPWGEARSPGCAHLAAEPGAASPAGVPPRPASVGHYPCDASPAGVLDLGGNVREWTEAGATSSGRVKGGSHLTPWWLARVAQGRTESAEFRAPDLGFRCVR